MKNVKTKPSKRRKPTTAIVAKALALSAQDAVEIHARANQPLVVWKDGKTALIPAKKATNRANGKRHK